MTDDYAMREFSRALFQTYAPDPDPDDQAARLASLEREVAQGERDLAQQRLRASVAADFQLEPRDALLLSATTAEGLRQQAQRLAETATNRAFVNRLFAPEHD